MGIKFKDLIIDDEDRKLFLVEDTALKAESIRNSILPRLENMLYIIIEEINTAFGMDVLEDSRITKSPNFRKVNRVKPVQTNYEFCSVGLTGKIKKDNWTRLIKNTNEISQQTPFSFRIFLTQEGFNCSLRTYHGLNLSGETFQFFEDWTERNFLKLLPLLQEAGVRYKLFFDETCKPFTPIDKYFAWKKEKKLFKSRFISQLFTYPLDEEKFDKILYIFYCLFPIYQTYIDLAKGGPDKSDEYIRIIQDSFYNALTTDSDDIEDVLEAAAEHASLINLNEIAEQKIRVMPGKRWQVFQRDNYKCVACGRTADDGIILHVDHILPRSKGGLDTLSNYQTLCHICNIGKSNKDDTDIKSLHK